ncbi:N-acetyl-beta-hexosaminidase [Pontibacter ummariensis]|uniref:beta-N-acetylhexosaminidase n=1 Tax=Pontibacter ummariensis TaxID=1610492 RepID=A0A239LTN8_9BACT|nr:family 20 glycosylhydrolase [Pontibacter ummariensis]PRY01037.1 N-acetyl-beta-hexosaminidase [Pontibacter ummariensis]SNT34027.1 N-acetyl-beta-hexosaminidase [Pontibacter ummariensis]
MRKFVFLFLLFISSAAVAQVEPGQLADSLFSTYYHQRATHFRSLPQTSRDIIFLGNSLSDGGEWGELFGDRRVKNRGISGDTSPGVMNRLKEVVLRKPEKVFLLVGTNDLARGIAPDSLLKNLFWIADYLRREAPLTQLYIQSILPVNGRFKKFSGHTGNGKQIKHVNAQLQTNAARYNYSFIDLHTPFSDRSGNLNASYTNDGLHLNGNGYMLWKHLVFDEVFDLQAKPAILPAPQQLQWTNEAFPLYQTRSIVIQDPELQAEAMKLKSMLREHGLAVQIKKNAVAGEPHIVLAISSTGAPRLSEEAYTLEVTNDKVQLKANTGHGIFNGVQTLAQLMRDKTFIPGCQVRDWPAYGWRGYMVDVGRNYQTMEMIKEQIDVMARYKLNIFHFHLTEDIAWRLEVPRYPQLTAPEHMTRNKGAYYTVDEMQELIQYCKDRHITLVPEIDMPGHSAAFTRAMGVDMQSEQGLAYLKNILSDFCDTYDVPYVHIGGDEVEITNQAFLPQVTAWLHERGKKTIGWDPGGNLDKATVRQLWMRDGAVDSGQKYIDSRHLYINHMDPLEAITTIFSRRIGDRDTGDSVVLGGTLCLWHDRNVLKQEDVLQMNPVYPSILAFAERSWKGGGYPGWITNIQVDQTKQQRDFQDFENRLLDHQKSYFEGMPFPYAAQAGMTWKLFGPYKNKGDVFASFAPERKIFKGKKPAAEAAGGTVVLRHFWDPLVTGVLKKPEENTTWYATTQFWSDVDTTGLFWIGFQNLSRSQNSDTPANGTWDNKGSAVYLNGEAIAPPAWKRAGQQGNPEIPLIDEGYEYRVPIAAPVKKGWNTVLVKLPVASFKGRDWHNPVKWMFTFIPLDIRGLRSHTETQDVL